MNKTNERVSGTSHVALHYTHALSCTCAVLIATYQVPESHDVIQVSGFHLSFQVLAGLFRLVYYNSLPYRNVRHTLDQSTLEHQFSSFGNTYNFYFHQDECKMVDHKIHTFAKVKYILTPVTFTALHYSSYSSYQVLYTNYLIIITPIYYNLINVPVCYCTVHLVSWEPVRLLLYQSAHSISVPKIDTIT